MDPEETEEIPGINSSVDPVTAPSDSLDKVPTAEPYKTATSATFTSAIVQDESLFEVSICSRRLSSILVHLETTVLRLAKDVCGIQEHIEKRDDGLQRQHKQMEERMQEIAAVARPQQAADWQERLDHLHEGVLHAAGRIEELETSHEEHHKRIQSAEHSTHDINVQINEKAANTQTTLNGLNDRIEVLEANAPEVSARLASVHAATKDSKDAIKKIIDAAEQTDEKASLLYRIFSLKQDRVKESLSVVPTDAQRKASSAGALPPPLQYLCGLPVFLHMIREMDSRGEKAVCTVERMMDDSEKRGDSKIAAVDERVTATADKLARKVDLARFSLIESEVSGTVQRVAELRRDANLLNDVLEDKVSNTTFNANIAHLQNTKCDSSELLRLPGKEQLDALKSRVNSNEEKLTTQTEHIDSEIRHVHQLLGDQPTNNTTTTTTTNHPDIDRLKKSVDSLNKGQTLLKEGKVDKGEWTSLHDFVESLADAVEKMRRGEATENDKKLSGLKRSSTPLPAAGREVVSAACDMAAIPVPSPMSEWQPSEPNVNASVPADQNASTTVTVPTAGMLRPVSRPNSGGTLCYPTVPRSLQRPLSASSTISSVFDFSEDHISVQMPLHHIPQGLRMGRASRLTTSDGGVTNATITASVDMIGKYPVSPSSQPRLTM